MVLFKRKPVTFPEPEPLPEELNVRCWYIPHTKEWFLLYDDYLKRMDYYKTRKFVCEITGNSCLTFFEAYDSEVKEMKLVENNFPEHLKEPILRHLQFSTVPRIDQLVDEVYGTFKNDYYPGETVMIRLNDYRNDYKTRCIIREKAKFNAIYDADNNVERPAYCQYRVSRVDSGVEVVVDESQITRDRNNFTKWFVKTFIKLSVTRSAKIGAPWIVKKKYAERYRIPSELPPHLAHFKEEVKPKGHFRKFMSIRPKSEASASSTKPSGRSTPELKRTNNKNVAILPKGAQSLAPSAQQPVKRIFKEDLENPFELTTRKPMPHAIEDLGDYISDALESWAFLNVYREPLALDTFTFDDFLTAMRWSSNQRCILLDELFCAVLSGFARPGAKELETFIPEEIDAYSDSEDTKNKQKNPMKDSESDVKQENGGMKSSDEDNNEEEEQAEVEGEDEDGEQAYEENDRVDEYIMYRNQSYIDRLAKRSFKDGGWQIVLLGVLDEVRHFKEWKDQIKLIFQELAPLDASVSPGSLLGRFLDLGPGLRVKALNILCSLLVNSPTIRQHIEKCMEESTALRRERLEKIREYKLSYEKAQDIDKELREIHDSNKAGSTTDPANPDQPQAEQESKKRRRRAGIKAEPTEAELKFAQENEQFASLLAARTAQLKLAEDMRSERRKLERQIVEIDVQRIKYLGKDRLFNRYWWFENNGLPNLGGGKHSDEDDDEEDEDEEDDEEDDLHDETYLMGRLWIQGPTEEDAFNRLNLKKDLIRAWRTLSHDDDENEEGEETDPQKGDSIEPKNPVEINDENETQEEIKPTIFKDLSERFVQNADVLFNIKFDPEDKKIKSSLESRILVDEYGATATGITPVQRKIIEEHPDPLLSSIDWRFYDKAEDIEKLIKWLYHWGIRENKLIKELNAVKDRIISSIDARRKALRLDSKSEEEVELLKVISETAISDTEPESEEEDFDDSEEQSDTGSSDVEKIPETEMRRTRRSIAEAEKLALEKQKREESQREREAEREARKERARPAGRVARREQKRRKVKEHRQKRNLIATSKERLEQIQEEKELQRCQDWVNSSALEKLGYMHYEGPKKTKGRRR